MAAVRVGLLFAAAVFAAGLVPPRARAQGDAGSNVYKRVVRSVVWIHSGRVTGSGTLVDLEKRLVLTNYHVVEEEPRDRVFFPAFRDGELIAEKKFYRDRLDRFAIRGKVIAKDRAADLAVIQIDAVPEGVLAVPVSATAAEPGQSVHSIGNAGKSDGLWGYVPGKVRQVYRKKWAAKAGDRTLNFDAKVVETDSPTNPGDSGGPLVNDKGELVGVTQGGALNAQLVSTFIDVSEVRRLLNTDDVKRAKADKAAADTPAPKREKAVVAADGAKLFPADAVKKAQEEIDALFAKQKLDVLIETYAAVPAADAAKVKAMTNAEQTRYMADWATDRKKAEKVSGVIVMICNDPKKLYVTVTADVKDRFPTGFEKKIIDLVTAGLRGKKFDTLAGEIVTTVADNYKGKS